MNLQQIKDKLYDISPLKKIEEMKLYKKAIIVGKLINFTCTLEKLEKINKSQKLNEDILWIKELIRQYELDTDYLLLQDLTNVNKLHSQYKNLIKNL